MRSLYSFIVKPKTNRYNNSKEIDGKELVLNTELQNHRFVSREGIVLEVPMNGETDIKVGDEVIVHHNVFRRFHDVRGEEKNSKSYFQEDKYFVYPDQIFLYKRDNEWKAPYGFCFVKPIENNDVYSIEKERPLVGVVKYLDDSLKSSGIQKNDLVGFRSNSEYEFIIDGEKLYRVLSNFITIKYEYQGDEKEYNPGW
jgi:hypothetical protein